MNRTECAQLMTIIASYDNRKLDEAVVIAWQAALDDLDLEDCRTFVLSYFRTCTGEWLMPGHVRQGVKRIRADRLSRIVEGAPDADPDDPSAYIAALKTGRQRGADAVVPRNMRALDSAFTSVNDAVRPDAATWTKRAMAKVWNSKHPVLEPVAPEPVAAHCVTPTCKRALTRREIVIYRHPDLHVTRPLCEPCANALRDADAAGAA